MILRILSENPPAMHPFGVHVWYTPPPGKRRRIITIYMDVQARSQRQWSDRVSHWMCVAFISTWTLDPEALRVRKVRCLTGLSSSGRLGRV